MTVSRVPADILRTIAEVIRTNHDFAVTTHVRMDGDAVGCLIAFSEILQSLGKNVCMVNNTRVPDTYEFMVDKGEILPACPFKPEVVFALDCANAERLGLDLKEAGEAMIINIDHHPTNTLYGAVNWVDGSAPCVGEMLLDLFTALKLNLSARAADSLYISLLTDTGRFSFTNTSCRAFAAAGKLCSLGVNPGELAAEVYFMKSPAKMKFFSVVYGSLEFSEDYLIAYISVTERQLAEYGLTVYDTQELSDIPRNSRPSELGIFFLETNSGETRVSFRSKSFFDCSELAACFGGGGHRSASGATVRLPLAEARKAVLQKASELQRRGK
ncbi:MAG: bifunctional oligoribonuclease/PAP phosphatase NrnA [Planctomycetota bacterium]